MSARESVVRSASVGSLLTPPVQGGPYGGQNKADGDSNPSAQVTDVNGAQTYLSEDEGAKKEEHDSAHEEGSRRLQHLHSTSMTVTPAMRQAVVNVVNDRLAVEIGPDYRLTATPDGAHLLLADDDRRVLLWVQVTDNTSEPFRAWVTADGRSCESLADVEEEMSTKHGRMLARWADEDLGWRQL